LYSSLGLSRRERDKNERKRVMNGVSKREKRESTREERTEEKK
jgi:hypothetical protein